MKRLTYQEACVEGIAEEMRRDESVFVLGNDIGAFGGALMSHKGLWQEFGDTGRIVETPISECAMVGACTGAAMQGMRPVVQIMFGEFLPAVTQPLVEAAVMWYYSAGKTRVPLVLRMLYGIGPHRGHEIDLHSWLTHIPGLKVVMPATPYDAKGLMKAAIRDNNPVAFFEHMNLYHGSRQEIPEADYTIPLGIADIKCAGKDVTVVAIAMMVPYALEAAEELSREGIEVEVIDLRTVAPLDVETILTSVRKTGRLVITHETWKTGGSGAEIAATVTERAFADLKAPIIRVAPPHIPIPYSEPLNKLYLPKKVEIIQGIREVLK
ncbi:MAG: alpha-ketoacid dehydrogenase subunit beta [Deltaproteobacteria bacterium]|jgi:pyruvate/2-oxoglutarate/acetoin dehydrogenase E1 component|nr:alpha-ketoacid dehydrogenase subunit beta [Deltaproteobacteria bacterium]MBT4637653.1 alpha-ketoacid dehydrogenase subunit beta [Deltaproteobacteria bacterium]MBT6498325.1 alpha-ketoacid dehydrogenase subunit beta [Deltaproteobacteria bacterium]MBT7152496.1 alpha-ketoacid dehydrogenase subunit beta [Deltaproteobacteria bacterium]MBT7711272.1 alpha-ketoacid dehydrogenase subunit beta [Deltaproteobacteria bacterium]